MSEQNLTKMTDLGQLPADWDVVEVGLLCKVHGRIGFRGYTTQDLVPIGQGALAIGGKHITHCVLDLSSPDFISWEKYYESPEIMVNKGDIVVAQRGTLGKAAIIDREIGPATINPSLVLLNSIRCNPYYLYYFLVSEPVTSKILSQSGLTSIPMISQKQVEGIKIALPHESEQNKIAEALWKMSSLITSLDKVILKKRMIKQGSMQQLLTGKVRLKGFSKPWDEMELGQLVDIKRGSMLKSSEYQFGTIPVIAGGITPAGYHNVANRTGRTITVSASGANAGYVSMHVGPIFATDCSTISEAKDKSYYIDFVYQYLVLHQQDIFRAQTGGAQPHIHPKDISPMKIEVPDYDEQFKIATYLSTMDKEIAALEAERDKYKNIKQGMMQQLLTGQIRLPV